MIRCPHRPGPVLSEVKISKGGKLEIVLPPVTARRWLSRPHHRGGSLASDDTLPPFSKHNENVALDSGRPHRGFRVGRASTVASATCPGRPARRRARASRTRASRTSYRPGLSDQLPSMHWHPCLRLRLLLLESNLNLKLDSENLKHTIFG
jgi:hypothetical protein